LNNVTIIIPTRGRKEKLFKALESIPVTSWIDIRVVCDGDTETFLALKRLDRPGLLPVLVQPRRGSIYCRNSETCQVKDGLIFALDDIEFQKGAIEEAFELFNRVFPDDDGVVGFRQHTGHFHKTWLALVGKEFLHRYPGKKLFFPGYFHFGSQEIGSLCEKIETTTGKRVFAQSEKSIVTHYHPAYYGKLVDKTHHEARERKKQDMALSKLRKSKGEVWGKV